MINKINFGSIYKVTSIHNDNKKIRKFEKYAISQCDRNGVNINSYDYQSPENALRFVENIVLTVPDKMDNEVELFCKLKKISYKKYQETNPTTNND